jgi:NitT/TauT family transport system substrate-binding protein
MRRGRLYFWLAGALIAVYSGAGLAQAPTKLRFTLDWRFEGQLAMFMMAKNKGYYEREGLDVQVDSGAGSAAAISRIAGGSHDVGTGDITSLIEYLSNNPGPTRLQAVYLLYSETPFMVHALKKSGIAKPQDLAGKTIGAPVFDAARKSFPIFAKQVGIDPKSVTWQNVDAALRETMIARGDLTAATGFEVNRLNLVARGVKEEDIVMFRYADHGVKLYGNAILASKKLIDENPKALAAFVRASNRALVDTIADPAEAVKYVKQFDPLVDEARELQKLRLTLRAIDTETARSGGLGAVNKVALETQVDDVTAAFGLKTKPNADLIFNSDFLPPRGDRIPRAPARAAGS